jgi:hypothetical protein
MAFLKLLFFFLVMALAIGGYVIYHIFRTLHQAAGQFGKQGDGSRSRQSSQRQQRTTTTSAGDVIIDGRTPGQSQQKIFKEGEGEYVDFKEE